MTFEDLQQLCTDLSLPVSFYDSRGSRLWQNPAASSLFKDAGLPGAGNSVAEAVSAFDGLSQTGEWSSLTGQARHYRYHRSLCAVALSDTDCFMAVDSDITTAIERQDTAALDVNELLQFRALAEQAGNAILICDNDHRIRFLNKQARDQLAVNLADKALPLSLPDVLSPESCRTLADRLKSMDTTLWQGQLRLQPRYSSRYFHMDTRVIRIHNIAADSTAYGIIFDDKTREQQAGKESAQINAKLMETNEQLMELISVHEQTEQDLQRMNLELEARVTGRTEELERSLQELRRTQKALVETEKMAALGTLVAGIAHEVNTPLGVAITASSHLADLTNSLSNPGTQADSDFLLKLVEVSRFIEKNLQRAAELVKSFKQVSIDHSLHQTRVFALKEFFNEFLPGFIHEIQKNGHRIHLDCPESLMISANTALLAQIFSNLILNSLYHAFDTIGQGEIEIRCVDEHDSVLIAYSDNGSGMEKGVLDKLYEPFFTTARGSGRPGLGMHIVYNQVTLALGGSIDVFSSPGQGTSIEIRIPRQTGDTDT